MKIFSASQIKQIDTATIQREQIASIDLMERAAQSCLSYILQQHQYCNKFHILCGPGNNGGDGLALARMLGNKNYVVTVYVTNDSSSYSVDYLTNLERIKTQGVVVIAELSAFCDVQYAASECIIDALFGSGLRRPLEGVYKDCIVHANNTSAIKYAIDIPSGLPCDSIPSDEHGIFKADYTLSFQFPKLSFFFTESSRYVGTWILCDIQLDIHAISQEYSPYRFLTNQSVVRKKRMRFSHKGNYGHVCIVAGSEGKNGAAVLAAISCLKAGAGLVTAYVPKMAQQALLARCPEIMTIAEADAPYLHKKIDLSPYSVLGIGPGLGTHPDTKELLVFLLQQPCYKVIDADALNSIAEDKELRSLLNETCVLTPHPGEFDRITHKHNSTFERFNTLREFAKTYSCYVVLKGAYTQCCTPNSEVYFNSTGNPGMATAGSGDVLTGILTGLLAQSYTIEEAMKMAVYLHGKSADIALEHGETQETITAQTLITYLPHAFSSCTH